MSAFGEALRQARNDRGLSVRRAAAEAKVSPSTWSKIENDDTYPGPHVKPLLQAWLDAAPQPFPPRRVDDAIALIGEFYPNLDEGRRARLAAITAA
jgi:transcriptional regulator with XRE-family HTH domain